MSRDEDAAERGDAGSEPVEEPTQPLVGTRAESGPAEGRQATVHDAETTILSTPQAPPALVDEGPTSVLPGEPLASEPEPEPEREEALGSEPGSVHGALPAAGIADDAGDPEPIDEQALEQVPVSAPDRDDAASLLSPVLPPVSEAATVVTETSTKSLLAPSSSLRPMLLERVEPSLGRGERMRLDASHWRVRLGRAESNDIRLYTASASREHAEISGSEAGEWILTPGEGKSVLVDGDPIREPVVLEVGMNLVMGGDQLRCVTEGLGRAEMSAQTSAEGLSDGAPGMLSRLAAMGLGWWLIAAMALAGLGLIAFAWFGG